MLLLDRVVERDPQCLTAELTIRPDHPFMRTGGVGAWIALEFMAQAVAALAGWEAREAGIVPQPGFIIGSRHFSSNVPWLPSGLTLQVRVTQDLRDESGLAAFTGRVWGRLNEEIEVDARATLTVFQPHDIEQFMRENLA